MRFWVILIKWLCSEGKGEDPGYNIKSKKLRLGLISFAASRERRWVLRVPFGPPQVHPAPSSRVNRRGPPQSTLRHLDSLQEPPKLVLIIPTLNPLPCFFIYFFDALVRCFSVTLISPNSFNSQESRKRYVNDSAFCKFRHTYTYIQ